MTISSQMMKGLLDGATLGLIARGKTYGCEILEKLKGHQSPEISDGSIYPVLLRLDKRGHVHTIMRKSDDGGPNCKYYAIPESELKEPRQFKEKWQMLNKGMSHILRSGDDDKQRKRRLFI